MGNVSARRPLGLPKFAQICHRILSLFFNLWNGGDEPSRNDDTFFKGYAGMKERKKKEVFVIERCKDLEGLDEKRKEAQECSRGYRKRMTEPFGRTTK